MSERHGRVHWSELMTRDYEAAKQFYADMCGWTYEDMDGMNGSYVIAKLDGKPVAGIGDCNAMNLPDEVPSHWMTYIAIDDVDVAAEKIASIGGTVKQGPFNVPGGGRIAIVEDPSGAVVGYSQPAS